MNFISEKFNHISTSFFPIDTSLIKLVQTFTSSHLSTKISVIIQEIGDEMNRLLYCLLANELVF
jgi:hypothetical protein